MFNSAAMRGLISYILICAKRDTFFKAFALVMLLAFLFSFMLGSTMITESTQSTIALFASYLRIFGVFAVVLFIIFHIKSAFDNKEMDMILSKPISLLEFVLYYYISLFIICFGISVLSCSCLIVSGALKIGAISWSIGFLMEMLVTVFFSLFVVLSIRNHIVASFATIIFYLLCRILGFYFISFNNPVSTIRTSAYGRWAHDILHKISYLFPRFDIFTKSEWLLYNNILVLDSLLLGGVYILLLYFMTVFDLKKCEL